MIDDAKPLFTQIAEKVEDSILNGTLPELSPELAAALLGAEAAPLPVPDLPDGLPRPLVLNTAAALGGLTGGVGPHTAAAAPIEPAPLRLGRHAVVEPAKDGDGD